MSDINREIAKARLLRKKIDREMDKDRKLVQLITKVAFIFFVLLLVFVTCTASVPAGHQGLVDTFGNVAEQTVYPGFHVKSPVTAIVPMSIKTQKYVTTAQAASKDLQDVITEVTVNYSLDGQKVRAVYTTIGLDYEKIVIVPATQEAVKAASATFTAEQLITQRPLVKQAVELNLKERLNKYYVNVEAVSLTNFTFSEKFTAAIEAKVEAEQNALKAENVLQRIKIEKEQIITQAQADAEAVKLNADAMAFKKKAIAEADAYALKVIREELEQSEELIPYRTVEAWNGQLPTFYGGGYMPFLDVLKAGEST